MGGVYSRTPLGYWTVSAISQGFWLAFTTACLLMLFLMLSTKEYDFGWETTILSDTVYIHLTRLIGFLPSIFGFDVPSAEQIAASHWTGYSKMPVYGGYREAWSGLLMGSVFVYGVLPRIVALVVCLVMRRMAESQFRLDLSLPGYARLSPRLVPVARTIGVTDPDPGVLPKVAEVDKERMRLPMSPSGPVMVVGYELDIENDVWPPAIDGVEWFDLGNVESRRQRHEVLDTLHTITLQPRALAVVCSVTTTPDRGVRGFVSELQAALEAPVLMLLSDGHRLRERFSRGEFEQRFEDWHALALTARIEREHVLDVDLEHLTDISRARLLSILMPEKSARQKPPESHLRRAFGLIERHAGEWSNAPTTLEQTELQKEVAALYEKRSRQWRQRFWGENSGDDLAERLKQSSQGLLDSLPLRLRRNPRWYAAGALAGAVGCVAATAAISSAAIATLPMWAGLGAAVTAFIDVNQKNENERNDSNDNEPAIEFSRAIHSAVLFALVLELQGHREVEISELIDRILPEQEPPLFADRDEAKSWCRDVFRRYQQAVRNRSEQKP